MASSDNGQAVRNIIILGESGTGKSSLINSIATVLSFETLKHAENNAADFKPPIAFRTKFNGNEIFFGEDINEGTELGASRTKRPQVFRLQSSNCVFNLIDTPGILDSGGQDVDSEHVKNIISCLEQYQEIHAVLILLKASENTLNDSLKYTLNMIFSCFSKAAVNCISFGITHCGHNKNTGGASTVFSEYLKGLDMDLSLRFETENVFCFESIPFFHIMATKLGYDCSQDDQIVYNLMYANNAEEIRRLLHAVYNCKDPYFTSHLPAFTMARQLLPEMSTLISNLANEETNLQSELKQLEAQIVAKDAEYGNLSKNLQRVRRWTEPYQVQRSRVVNQNQTVVKTRVVEEHYTETIEKWVDGGRKHGGVFGKLRGGRRRILITENVPRVRYVEQQYNEQITVPVTETYYETLYRNCEAVEEDSTVRQSLNRIQNEKTALNSQKLEMSKKCQRFEGDLKLLREFESKLQSHLNECAIVSIKFSSYEPSQLLTNPTLDDFNQILDIAEKSEFFGARVQSMRSNLKPFVCPTVDLQIAENLNLV